MFYQPLTINPQRSSSSASGLAVLFFLLGTPNIYGALRQRAYRPAATQGLLRWALGLGILTFIVAGTTVCVESLA